MAGISIDYVGDFDAERHQLEGIISNVKSELNAMETTVNGMGSYWSDSKSQTYISYFNELITKLKTASDKAQSTGYDALSKAEKALNIYTN